MNNTFLFFSLWGISFVLYLAFPSLIPGGVFFLLPVSIQAVWMLRISLGRRLLLATLTGVLFDAVGSAPYGAHLLSFLLMAAIAELLIASIANSDSVVAQMLMSMVMVLFFAACLPIVSILLRMGA